MVTGPQDVSSQTQEDCVCVRLMATPVRADAKEGRDSVLSRGPGPQTFDPMVWPNAWRGIGVGRSDGRRGTGQARVGFVHQRFPSSQHHRLVFDARFIPAGQILQDHQSQRALHCGLQESSGSNGYTDRVTASLSRTMASSLAPI